MCKMNIIKSMQVCDRYTYSPFIRVDNNNIYLWTTQKTISQYTLIGENFDPDEETIVKEANNKKDIEDAFNESKDDFDSLYVVLNDESYAAYSKGSKLIWK